MHTTNLTSNNKEHLKKLLKYHTFTFRQFREELRRYPTSAIGTLHWLVSKGHLEFVTMEEGFGDRGLSFMKKKYIRKWRVTPQTRKALEQEIKREMSAKQKEIEEKSYLFAADMDSKEVAFNG